MSDIKPAMTKEEWELPLPDQFNGYIDLDVSGVVDIVVSGPNDRHRLAAIMLYGQPFGFTREDVGFLRSTIRHFEEAGPASYGREEELRSLADRIEALLPPEGP